MTKFQNKRRYKKTVLIFWTITEDIHVVILFVTEMPKNKITQNNPTSKSCMFRKQPQKGHILRNRKGRIS